MIEAFRENGLNVADAETKISRPRLETLVSSLYASLSKRLPSSSTDHHHQGKFLRFQPDYNALHQLISLFGFFKNVNFLKTCIESLKFLERKIVKICPEFI